MQMAWKEKTNCKAYSMAIVDENWGNAKKSTMLQRQNWEAV
jgi:hypothetical protein